MAEPTDDVKSTGEGDTPPASSADNKPADTQPEGDKPQTDKDADTKPKGGDGEPKAEPTVPLSRFKDEVSRWKKRALDSEVRAKAREVVGEPAKADRPVTDGEDGKLDSSQFVTREELDETRRRDELVSSLVADGRRCIERFDGSDGWPKFDLDEVSEYMKKSGHTSYEEAYRSLHFTDIVEAEKTKAVEEASKKGDHTTVTDGGPALGNPPAEGAITKDKIAKMDLASWQKMGGSKNPDIRKAVLSGQLK